MIWPLSASCVEGALARVAGLERFANPYDVVNAPERHRVWEWAWVYADRLLEANIDRLVVGWSNEDEAA